ncbi:hypothetical protein D3C73_420820 [compost metagenome]
MPRRSFNILFAQSRYHIFGRDIICRHTIGFYPYTHRIITHTHNLSESYPFNTFQLFKDIDIGEIIDETFICSFILSKDIQVHQHGVDFLLCRYPSFNNLLRQFIQYSRYPVLNINRSNIRVRSYFKENLYHRTSVISRYGVHIGHPCNTIDRFLQWNSDGISTYFGIRTSIVGVHNHRRRYNIWELRNRQRK